MKGGDGLDEFILPYRSGSVTLTSRFGWRTLNGKQDYHKGVDLVGTDKTLVSPCDGVVRSSTIITDKSNTTWEWGNYIRIDRADGLQIFMCHMASRNVTVGQTVKAGDIVGIEGNTGYSFGSHCHFEVRKNGTSVDPTPYLGIANAAGTYPVKNTHENASQVKNTPDYASLVCQRCGLEAQTKIYLDQYKYASDLWRKLWEAMS